MPWIKTQYYLAKVRSPRYRSVLESKQMAAQTELCPRRSFLNSSTGARARLTIKIHPRRTKKSERARRN